MMISVSVDANLKVCQWLGLLPFFFSVFPSLVGAVPFPFHSRGRGHAAVIRESLCLHPSPQTNKLRLAYGKAITHHLVPLNSESRRSKIK